LWTAAKLQANTTPQTLYKRVKTFREFLFTILHEAHKRNDDSKFARSTKVSAEVIDFYHRLYAELEIFIYIYIYIYIYKYICE